VSATAAKFSVEAARLKAEREGEPCIAAKAFPVTVPESRYRDWCRKSLQALCAGRRPYFTCWKVGKRWFVDKVEVDEFLTCTGITPVNTFSRST
jgi:hypothetical protein